MLEGVLEQLFLQFLAPYVEGISRDKLHFGIFSGALELNDLEVRKDALDSLGVLAYRIRRGRIGSIKLDVAWKQLFVGKLKATVDELVLEIETRENGDESEEQLAKLIEELREAKEKAINMRMHQLGDLLQRRSEAEADQEGNGEQHSPKKGFGVRLVRKILHNLTIQLSRVEIILVNERRGFASVLGLQKLSVLSTDEDFNEIDVVEVSDTGSSAPMHKLLNLEGLSLKMSPAGCADFAKVVNILSPLTVSLRLKHKPSESIVSLRIEIAIEELAELFLRRSQVKHVRRVLAAIKLEELRVFQKMVPPEAERSIFANTDASRDAREEYSRLYERWLLAQWIREGVSLDEFSLVDAIPLMEEDVEGLQRKQLLEDAFAVRVLAVTRLKAWNKLGENHEVVCKKLATEQRQREEETQRSGSLWSRLLRRSSYEVAVDNEGEVAEYASAPLETLLEVFDESNDKSKFEDVDLPQRFSFEFVLGNMAIDLIDDQWHDEVRRQLASVAVQGAHLNVEVELKADHRGKDSAEWSLNVGVGAAHALHHTQVAITTFCPTVEEDRYMADMANPGDLRLQLDMPSSAARLEIANDLKEDMNLLRLKFDFRPVQVHMLPGIAEYITEFWRAPLPQIEHGRMQSIAEEPTDLEVDDGDLRNEDLKYMAKQVLEQHGDHAKNVVEQVYQRIPDKLQIDLSIASPMLHVPVYAMGTSKLSLGELKMTIPPCAYDSIDMTWILDHTSVTAQTKQGERFDMIQPVKATMKIEYRGNDEENQVLVQVNVEEEVILTLSPQAMQILIATIPAFLETLWKPPTDGMSITEEHSVHGPSSVLQIGRQSSSPSGGRSPSVDEGYSLQQLRGLAEEVLPGKILGTEGDAILSKVEQQVETAKKKLFRFNLGVQWEVLDVTFSDSMSPVMKLRMGLMDPGLVMYQQSKAEDSPYKFSLTMHNCTADLSVLNPYSGAWEPIAEHFQFSFEMNRWSVDEERRATHLIVSGQEELRVNLKPMMLRRASEYIPLFVSSFLSEEVIASSSKHEGTSSRSGYYRVVNICADKIELVFRSAKKGIVAKCIVEPTGSGAETLDDKILPHFADAVGAASLEQKRPERDWIPLDRIGASVVHGSDYIAELLTPSPSHRLLLLSTRLRVHNHTKRALQIRFFDAERVEVAATGACDASLLGHFTDVTSLDESDPFDEPLKGILRPNDICSVPLRAIIPCGERRFHCKALFCVRPADGSAIFSKPIEIGTHDEPCKIVCSRIASPGTGDVHLLCAPSFQQYPTAVTTVALRPTLAFLNAVPIGGLEGSPSIEVKYWVPTTEKTKAIRNREKPHQAVLKAFKATHVYDFRGADSSGIALQVRLHPDGVWSETFVFGRDADEPMTKTLRQTEGGGAAAVLVEPLHNFMVIRISCPYWFVNRSGLPAQVGELEVHSYGKKLPQQDGITLLPADVLEKSCDFVISKDGKAVVAKSVRLPPSWTMFPWKAGQVGHRVLCVQTEDVAKNDVLGAHCQVMTLRPRLIMTNASDCLVEVKLSEKRVDTMELEPGKSGEHHWQIKIGDKANPSTTVRFRPKRIPPCEWSSEVLCGDGAAGTAQLAIATREEGGTAARGSVDVEVWTVEVSPMRGSLAVIFREGSDFVAINNCERMDAQMEIRPHGFGDSVKSILVPKNTEVPLGWTDPFMDPSRAVALIVFGTKTLVKDIRRSKERTPMKRSLPVAWTVHRVGVKTVLSLQDDLEAVADALAPTSNAGVSSECVLFHVDIRLGQLGVSIIEEPLQQLDFSRGSARSRAREILYLHFDLIRFNLKEDDNDVRTFSLAVSEAQVDCQLSSCVDATSSSLDRRREISRSFFDSERPSVIFANRMDGDRAFLTLNVQRGASGSEDMLIHKAEIALDTLDITVDDQWLNCFADWVNQCKSRDDKVGVSFDYVRDMANKSALFAYAAPEPPKVIHVDHMRIGALDFTLWCDMKLKTSTAFSAMPPFLRTAIQLLSFNGDFTMDGAHFYLPARLFPPHRGSLRDFSKGLGSEYITSLIKNAAAMLGKSSLLNLPRVPIQLGGTFVSYLSDSLGLAAGEAASLMNQLTFDDEYIQRQRHIREAKRIGGFGDGVVEAGKSLAQGFEGFADIWRKPLEGARTGGFSGWVSGVGFGCAGTFVKPISKLGQAISDVGSGIAASVGSDSAGKRRLARVRQRLPRLLFEQFGTIRPWCELESQVMQQLGNEMTTLGDQEGGLIDGIEEVLLLRRHSGQPHSCGVLLLFRDRFVTAWIKTNNRTGPRGRGSLGTTGSTPATSSSTPVAAEDGASSDESSPEGGLLEAIDESALKILDQVWKPINAAKNKIQDLKEKAEDKLMDKKDTTKASASRNKFREWSFEEFTSAKLSSAGEFLELVNYKGTHSKVPLDATAETPGMTSIGMEVRRKLAQGLHAAFSRPDKQASWEELRAAVLEERRARSSGQAAALERWRKLRGSLRRGRSGAGERVLVVFEVERKFLATNKWLTPFLPTDREFSWRWVDATGASHPHIKTNLLREAAAAADEPPCELGELFVPTSAWKCDKGSKDTDAEGWKYGLAWNASTWDVSPGLFDAIRKRRWTRHYE